MQYGATIVVPYLTATSVSSGSSRAVLTLVLPKNQQFNISVTRLGLYDGGVLLQNGDGKSEYELIAIALYSG